MDPQVIQDAMRLLLAFLARWEGIVLQPYLCSAGVPTIGMGSTRYPDGRAVKLTDPPISRETAIVIARDQLRRRYMRAVRAYCPELVTAERLAAISSLTYNIGPAGLAGSTLRRRINAEAWDEVPAQIRRWNRASGRVVRGLTLRRHAEVVDLWERGEA